MYTIHRVLKRAFTQSWNGVLVAGLALLLPLTFVGCLGANGSESPQGPQGVHGSVDIQSLTLTLPQTEWKNQGTREVASWPASQITQTIVDKGTVLVYTDQGTGQDNWTALPFTKPVQDFNATLSYSYEAGTFSILITKDTDASLAKVFAGQRIRVVVVPPEGELYLNSIEAGNYASLETFFGL